MAVNNFSSTSREDMLALQLERLQWTVKHAYENNEIYRRKMDDLGVVPNDIKSLDDLTKLPLTDKEELRDAYPFGLMAVPEREIIRIHASSGTTGKKTVAYYTKKDIDDWAEMMARCFHFAGVTADDRVQITPGFGLWTAGIGFQLGVERLGAMAIPVGPVNNELQMELMTDFQTTTFCSTSSYALLLAEEVTRQGIKEKLNLRVGVIGSERWSDKMRSRVEELLGIETFDIIGMTELYGPGIGIDCHVHEGIHYWSDHFIFEILDPATGIPCPPGEQGELVATTLSKEGMPLLRYKTRDITRLLIEPCSCGSPFFRIDRILGRTDDMIKIRGVNIYPGQFDSLLSQMEEISCEYQIILTRQGGRDHMLLRVEANPGDNSDRELLADKVRQAMKVKIGVTPEVEIVHHQSLPRTERKTKRVFDQRDE
ncbi:MAG: phenylacetate--CoA ligase [Clostridia bacterium]|nr:phenylacetate--CoA ligase [Clostridia bacterium]